MDANRSREMHRIQDFAVDVELELFGRRVSNSDRDRVFVPEQMWQYELGQTTLACQTVHDLELSGVSGDGAQKPGNPGGSLLGKTGLHERIESLCRAS